MKIKFLFLISFCILFFSGFVINDSNDNSIVCVTYKMVKPQQADLDKMNKKLAEKDVSVDLKESIKKSNDLKYQLELELYYNKSKSLYKMVDAMEVNNDLSMIVAKISIGGDQIRFKDITKKEKMFQIETSGEKFNVTLPFEEYKWNISTESRILNGYKCFKATSYKEEFDKIRNRKNVFNPVVWFTPEIPTSFGPAGLDGLPGLVLEGSVDGRNFFCATKINFDYKPSITIERPSKGREVTEIEYLDIIGKMFEENNK